MPIFIGALQSVQFPILKNSKGILRTKGPINSKFGNRTKVPPRQCFLFLLRKWMYTELFA